MRLDGSMKMHLLCMMMAVAGVHTAGGDTIPASECGSYVKRYPAIGDVADLPHDGWSVWSNPDLGLRMSGLKNYKPKTIMYNGSGLMGNVPYVSPDGEWIMSGVGTHSHGTERDVFLVTKDGNTVKDIGLRVWLYTWWYDSPNQDAANGLFEIAYVKLGNKKKAEAVRVDLSGPEPVLGEPRTIADNLWDCNGEFHVSRDIMLFGLRTPTGRNPVQLLTIPDGGRGTASQSDVFLYGSHSNTTNCSAKLSWDAAYWSSNGGPKGYSTPQCYDGPTGTGVGGDIRFVIAHTRRKTDPAYTDMREWIADSSQGTNLFGWTPSEIDGVNMWNYVNWFDHTFTNRSEYQTVHSIPASGRSAPGFIYGVWLINRKTNTWTCVTAKDEKATGGTAAYFDAPSRVREPARKPNHGIRVGALGKLSGLDQWCSLLGRRIPGVVRAGSGVRVAVEGSHAARRLVGTHRRQRQ